MTTIALIDAMYHEGIFILCMVGILGVCTEMALRR